MIDYNREAAEMVGYRASIHMECVATYPDNASEHIKQAVRLATIAGHFGNLALGRHLWMVTDAAPLSPDGRYNS